MNTGKIEILSGEMVFKDRRVCIFLIKMAIFKIKLYMLIFEKISVDLTQRQAYLTKYLSNFVILIKLARVICNIQFIDYIQLNQTMN